MGGPKIPTMKSAVKLLTERMGQRRSLTNIGCGPEMVNLGRLRTLLMLAMSHLCIADTGVDVGVDHVGEEVDPHEHHGE